MKLNQMDLNVLLFLPCSLPLTLFPLVWIPDYQTNNGNICNQQLSASLFSTVNSHLKLRLVFLAPPPQKKTNNNKQTNPMNLKTSLLHPRVWLQFMLCIFFLFHFHCLSLTASEITTTFSPVLSCDVTILIFDLLSIDQLSPGINDSELNCLCLPGWCKVW